VEKHSNDQACAKLFSTWSAVALLVRGSTAAATPQSLYISGGVIGLVGTLAARAAQDDAVVLACMARNGYPKTRWQGS
jgi:hypothetical protein